MIPPLPTNARELLDRPDALSHRQLSTSSSRGAAGAQRVLVERPTILAPHYDTSIDTTIDRVAVWYSPQKPFAGVGGPDWYGIPAARNFMLLTPGEWWVLLYAEKNTAPAAPFLVDFIDLDARIPGLVERFISNPYLAPTTVQVKVTAAVGVGAPTRIITYRELIGASAVRVDSVLNAGSGIAGLRWGAPPAANRFIQLGPGESIKFEGPEIPAGESLWCDTFTGTLNTLNASIARL
jgi:hypothetical protein